MYEQRHDPLVFSPGEKCDNRDHDAGFEINETLSAAELAFSSGDPATEEVL